MLVASKRCEVRAMPLPNALGLTCAPPSTTPTDKTMSARRSLAPTGLTVEHNFLGVPSSSTLC